MIGRSLVPLSSLVSMRLLLALLVALLCAVPSMASAQAPQAPAPTVFLLRPARVFDGVSAKVQEGWAVLVRGDRIATHHARETLLAGFTTVRELGTEGAADADVGLKQAIHQGRQVRFVMKNGTVYRR